MSTDIYYFTGTGNSLALARQLVKHLGECRLIAIREKEGYLDVPVELNAAAVGLVVPVYCFGVPLAVARFIRRITVCNSKYVFAVSNCAGNPGFTLRQIEELLAERKIHLNAALNVYMPTNYLPFGGAWSPERQQKTFTAAAKALGTFAEEVKMRHDVPVRLPKFPPAFVFRWVYKIFSPKLPSGAKRFLVSDSCTRCGLCAKVCPTANIRLLEGHPIWGARCEQCLACIQWCPVSAITIKGVNPAKEHYHHPEVTAEDLSRDKIP